MAPAPASSAGDDPRTRAAAAHAAVQERADAVLTRYRDLLSPGLTQAVDAAAEQAAVDPETRTMLGTFYGQMGYHLGWRRADLRETRSNPGKLLRPTLVLLSYEFASATRGAKTDRASDDLARAVPAAVAVELVHNFSLIHDDIEDHDDERRHRPTLWRVWGQAQAINTGDGMFALARLALLRSTELGVAPGLVVELAALLDRTCLRLCEGQHLDMAFEGRRDITTAMYLAMIERKTAELMACALEMGARLGGASELLAGRLATFGRSLGMAFQLRDDLLGIWANRDQLGKVEAGDLRRKKMSLPLIYALEHAAPPDRQALEDFYAARQPATDEQIAGALAILERTGARAHVHAALREQGERARAALRAAGGASDADGEPQACLGVLVDYVVRDL